MTLTDGIRQATSADPQAGPLLGTVLGAARTS